MSTSRLVRNLGIGALGVIAAVAIACGGTSRDDASTGGGFPGEAPGIDVAGATPRDAIADGRTGVSEDSDAFFLPAGAATSKEQAPAPGGAPETLQTSIERKIVQTASLQLQVEEVGAGFEEVGRIATAAGGIVASSKFSYRDEQQIASVTIRVPSQAYQSVLSQLRGLAEQVDSEESNAADVTEEYTDLESRLRNLQATHDQLLNLLGRAQTVTDILTVQDRLNAVTGEVEHVKGRMQLLDNLTDLSTVTVHLRPVAGSAGDGGGSGVNLGETISEAWDDSLAFLGSVAEAVLTVVVFAWWVPLLGAPAAAVAWGVSRGRVRGAVAD